jgi:hypothetical protein
LSRSSRALSPSGKSSLTSETKAPTPERDRSPTPLREDLLYSPACVCDSPMRDPSALALNIPSLASVLPPEKTPKTVPHGQKILDPVITGVVSLPLHGAGTTWQFTFAYPLKRNFLLCGTDTSIPSSEKMRAAMALKTQRHRGASRTQPAHSMIAAFISCLFLVISLSGCRSGENNLSGPNRSYSPPPYGRRFSSRWSASSGFSSRRARRCRSWA